MSDALIFVDLVVLWAIQTVWCLYYGLRYDWRSTPLGSVWLTKGSALAILWALLAVDQVSNVPDIIFAAFTGPVLLFASARWLWVTVRVRREVEADR